MLNKINPGRDTIFFFTCTISFLDYQHDCRKLSGISNKIQELITCWWWSTKRDSTRDFYWAYLHNPVWGRVPGVTVNRHVQACSSVTQQCILLSSIPFRGANKFSHIKKYGLNYKWAGRFTFKAFPHVLSWGWGSVNEKKHQTNNPFSYKNKRNILST